MTETPEPTAREACPFCGGVSAGSLSSTGFDEIYVICDHCGCDGPVGSTEAEALRLWNARAEAAALRAEVERLRAALEWYADPENYDGEDRPGVAFRGRAGIGTRGSGNARANLPHRRAPHLC